MELETIRKYNERLADTDNLSDHNKQVINDFLRHMETKGISQADINSLSSRLSTLSRAIDFKMDEAEKDDIKKVVAALNTDELEKLDGGAYSDCSKESFWKTITRFYRGFIKSEAKVYESVENGEGETQKFKLENIPACSEEFDTREESSWKWGKYQKPDTLSWACYIYNNTEMSQKEVEILFDTSRTKISQNQHKYQTIEDIPA